MVNDDMPMPDPGQDTVMCLQMTVGFKDSLGMFLFPGWDGGRHSNFGYYFATLVFVATLAFIVEAVPLMRSTCLSPKKEEINTEYAAIQRISTNGPVQQTKKVQEFSFALHLFDTFIQLIAKVCMYLLMLSVMSYNFGVIMTASVALPLANFIFSIIQDRKYIDKRLRRF